MKCLFVFLEENMGAALKPGGLTAPRHHHGPHIYVHMCAYYEGLPGPAAGYQRDTSYQD
jgi:hypothetical protein